MCLICSDTIHILKEYNLKRYYCTKQYQYDNHIGWPKVEIVEKVKKALVGQKTFFIKKQEEANNVERTS